MAAGLVISAPASGVGKTTLTLALARAWRNRGLTVQCFKSGPDYIDPAFHTAATGRASVNVDSWAMDSATIAHLVSRGADADIVLAEGSMGPKVRAARQFVQATGREAFIGSLDDVAGLLARTCGTLVTP